MVALTLKVSPGWVSNAADLRFSYKAHAEWHTILYVKPHLVVSRLH